MLYSVLTLVFYRLIGAMFRKTISRAKKMFAPESPPETMSPPAEFVGSGVYLRKNTHQTTSNIGSMKGRVYWMT